MALIRCEDVSFSYDGNTAVSGLDFSVLPGDYLCIVGENGSGKSTLLKGLLRLKAPQSGSIRMDSGLLPSEIGYLPQQTAAQKDFPAGAYEVVLSGRLGGRGILPFYSKADKAAATEIMKRFDIHHLANRCYRELSGGQQQRVLLARALCQSIGGAAGATGPGGVGHATADAAVATGAGANAHSADGTGAHSADGTGAHSAGGTGAHSAGASGPGGAAGATGTGAGAARRRGGLKLLLLDEPGSGLDPIVTYDLYQQLAAVNRESGLAIVMVSHDIHGAVKNASKILHLENRQIFFGATQDYLKTAAAARLLKENDHDQPAI
jgi:ABC-type Mn2+/Zn2+ transport system ATPase subunit